MSDVKSKNYGSYIVKIQWDSTNEYYVVSRKSKKTEYVERFKNYNDALAMYRIFMQSKDVCDQLRRK